MLRLATLAMASLLSASSSSAPAGGAAPHPTTTMTANNSSHTSGPSSMNMGLQGSVSEPYFDRQSGKWMVEDASGTELEWDANRNAWVPAVSQMSM